MQSNHLINQFKKVKLVFHLDFDHKGFQERSFLSLPYKLFLHMPLFPMTADLFTLEPQWWTAAGCHSPIHFLSPRTWFFRIVSTSKGDGFTLEWEVERITVKLSPCLFFSTILSYFLLICSFQMCAESSALLCWFSVFLPSLSGFALIEWNPLFWFSTQSHWGYECPLTQFRATIE